MEYYGISIFIGILFVYYINQFYFKCKNIVIDINDLVIAIYLGAFLGGKLLYILCDLSFLSDYSFSFFSLDLLCGGFSLLGASFFAILSLLYYINKNILQKKVTAFLPISLLFLHSFGRLGCFVADCCGGVFYTLNLHMVSIFFYFLLSLLGLLLYFFNFLYSFYAGLYYYSLVIFLERFLFDIYRYDCIMLNVFFSKYQLFSILYLLLSLFCIFIFKKNTK